MAAAPSIRAACERVVSLAPGSQAYGSTLRTAIGIDACAFHSSLAPSLRRCLLDVHDVFESGCCGMNVGTRHLGKSCSWSAGPPPALMTRPRLTGRKRPDGDSWSDVEVVRKVLMWLIWYRRVIVVSIDRRSSPGGLMTLLNRPSSWPIVHAPAPTTPTPAHPRSTGLPVGRRAWTRG